MAAVMKKRVVVVCPGRGTYGKENLGYLKLHASKLKSLPGGDFINDIDRRRSALGQLTISELDQADAFKLAVHTRGENASALIYACAYADFMTIPREKYEIVAITGNSMGWYLALAFAGALDRAGAFSVINGMGSMMKDEIIGGQVIYPVVDESWRRSATREQDIKSAVERTRKAGGEVYDSIYLGGFIVFGADRKGAALLLKELPVIENYPFQLMNHAAFHTPLMGPTSERALGEFPAELFSRPELPLIDGRGSIWEPLSTGVSELYNYTFGHQVIAPYDFSKAIEVALKEFAPDHLILLGPGSSLGGSIGQILVKLDWYGMKSKEDFTRRQSDHPFLIAMGRPEQRALLS